MGSWARFRRPRPAPKQERPGWRRAQVSCKHGWSGSKSSRPDRGKSRPPYGGSSNSPKRPRNPASSSIAWSRSKTASPQPSRKRGQTTSTTSRTKSPVCRRWSPPCAASWEAEDDPAPREGSRTGSPPGSPSEGAGRCDSEVVSSDVFPGNRIDGQGERPHGILDLGIGQVLDLPKGLQGILGNRKWGPASGAFQGGQYLSDLHFGAMTPSPDLLGQPQGLIAV